MTEKKEHILIKLLPSILTVAGIVIGVWKFTAELDYRDRNEFRMKMWTKRLEAYEKLGDATAGVVNNIGDSAAFENSVKEFNNLYWGVLPMLQDSLVENRIKDFNDAIYYERIGENEKGELNQIGFDLMISCKQSLHDSWEELMEDE